MTAVSGRDEFRVRRRVCRTLDTEEEAKRLDAKPQGHSDMLSTLEARLGQARAGEPGHLEFLEVLLEDEILRREAKALSERPRRARFESEATLEATSPTIPLSRRR